MTVVHKNMHTHIYEQFLKMSVGLVSCAIV